MQWDTQAVNINTNLKVKIYFTLPERSAMKIMMWDCHVDDSTNDRYGMILGIDTLTGLRLNLKFSEHVIEAYDGPLKVSTSSMIYLITYQFKN